MVLPVTKKGNLKDVMAGLYGSYFRDTEKKDRVKIDEIPVMISNQGELVCIPNTIDEPTVGVVGAKSKGKSYFSHGLLERAYHYKDKDCFIGNDTMDETISWSKPNNDLKQKETLRKFGETSSPLPMVYFVPRVKLQPKPSHDCIYLSLPLDEILENAEQYMSLDKSAPYFRSMVEDFKGMTIDQICAHIDETLGGKQYLVKVKLQALMRDLEKEMILDQSNVKNVSKIKVYNARGGDYKEYNPINASMYAKLVPSILTGNLMAKHYKSTYLRHFFDDIYRNQLDDDYFKGRAIWGFLDEITSLCSTQKRASKVAESITQLVARGRPARIGIIYATQNYSKVESVIRTNTLYLFSFGYKSTREISNISRDFDLSKRYGEVIRELDKFNMLAMTSEYFVCYDNEGNSHETDEPIEGRALPTLSLHKKPTV